MDYALGRVTEHKDPRQLNKLALNAADLLKSETDLVTRFFCHEREPDSEASGAEKNAKSNSNSERDIFFKEREQLVLDNEEIYINDLLHEGEHPQLENLFRFVVDSSEGLNPTAAHYFTEIVTALIKREPEKMLGYIYARQPILNFMLANCDYHSVKNLLAKVLNLDKNEGKSNVNFKFFKHRFTLYNRLLREAAKMSNEALNNLMEVFTQLLKEDENVVDAEYFVERLFEEHSNFRRLLQQISAQQSPKLVELIELILTQVFKRADSDSWKSKKSHDIEDLKKSLSKKNTNGVLGTEQARSRVSDDAIEVEVHIQSLKEDKKENQPTAETSNDAIKNFDLEVYDPEEMKKLDLVNVLESELVSILSVLRGETKLCAMQPDGQRMAFSSGYKVSIVKLLKIVSKLEYKTIKDVLISGDSLRLYLVR